MDKKLFIVAKREYLERVRSKWFIVMTLAVPLLLAGAMIIPIYMSAKSGSSPNVRRIRILDATGAGLGERIAASLKADTVKGDTVSGPFVIKTTAAELPKQEEEAIREVMKPKSLQGVLVLDDSTLAGRSVRYAGRNASSISEIDKLETAVRQSVMMVRLQKEGVKQQTVDELSKLRVRMAAERISDRGRGGSGVTGILVGVVFGAMLLMSIIVHGQNVMRGVLEEKTTRVAEVVLSSLKPETLLAGKVLGVGAVGLTQVIAWLGLSVYASNFLFPIVLKGMGGGAAVAAGAGSAVNGPGSIFGGMTAAVFLIAIGYFVLGFIFYATLYAAAGSMVNSEQEAQQAATPVMLLLMSGWIFLNPVLINPNSTLAVVLSWLPWTSPILMPIRMGLTTVAPMSIAGSMVCAAIGSLLAVWLAARIYRVGMLMYGKKPTMREVVKWVRYA